VGLSRTIAAKEVHAAIERLASAIWDGQPGTAPLRFLGIREIVVVEPAENPARDRIAIRTG
jgi:hypothetical protein